MQLLPMTPAASRQISFTAFASVAIMVLTVIVGGAFTEGYSHTSQFISELGAREAPLESWVRFGAFLPAGALLLGFCLASLVHLPRSRALSMGLTGLAIYAAGYLVAAFFPCDPGCRPDEPSASQLVHNVGGLLGYLLAPLFLHSLGRAARTWPDAGHLTTVGSMGSVVALGGLLTLSPSSEWVGVSQRALEASVLVWVALFGVYVVRMQQSGA